jgi:exonuclease III
MKFYTISTTAYEEENFTLCTDLTESQIKEIIEPIIDRERRELDEYNNNELVDALREAYPSNNIYACFGDETYLEL